MAQQYPAGEPAGSAPPVEIVVHVDAAAGTLDDGTALAPPTTEQPLCDATVVDVVEP